MTRRACLVLSALSLSVGAGSLARAQTPAAVTIDVDAAAAGSPLEPVWAFYGYDEANYTTSLEGEALLRTLVAAHADPVHVRTHFLFNTGNGVPALKWGSTNIYTEDAAGNPVYDYTLIDTITDATTRAGAFPLVEIGFMPQALSRRPIPYENQSTYSLDGGCFYPPRDYEAWARLVAAWATHVKERYPGAESSWLWELWNEPDIAYWKGTFDEFARLYDHTEAALHAVFPGASLGGPAVASPDRSFLRQFLEHCASGTNAVTGQLGTRLDMVSFHAKGGVSITDGHVQMDLGNQLRLHRAGFDAVLASKKFARTPIVITEADPDGCAACPVSSAPQNAYRNSPAYGAYEVAMMKRTLELSKEAGVNLRGVLTWAFTFPGSPLFAGYRALSTNGIHLPVLNALALLGSLRGVRLPVESSGARPLRELLEGSLRVQPDIDALAAIEGDRIRILVWHYHDDLVAAPSVPVRLRVSVPPAFGSSPAAPAVRVTHTRVDETHGDAFTVWVSQGSPAAPSAPQLAALREGMLPVVLDAEREALVEGGVVSLSFDLPRFGVSLLDLVPVGASEPVQAPGSEASCSCRFAASSPSPPPALLALLLAGPGCRRRFARRELRGAPRRLTRPSKPQTAGPWRAPP
jgi:xylan 1,4-beta-xylosidase